MTDYAERTTSQLLLDLEAARNSLKAKPAYHRAVVVQVIERELKKRKVKPVNWTLRLVA